jgi:starch-binding outer membrane protein SusE/F
MKKSLHKILYIAAAGLTSLASCKKDQAIVYFEGGTAPVLTSTATDSISLPLSDTTETAVTFSWTNPNYQFSDGISSLDVTYYLEFDTVAGFNSGPNGSPLATVGLSSSLSQTYTVAQFNTFLENSMVLSAGNPHTIEVRVQSLLAPFTSTSQPSGVLISAPLTYTATPYALPPAVPELPTALWVTGSATADGWMTAGQPSSIAGQQMTEISPTLWTITMPLIGGQQFLIVPANNWNNKYATSDGSETGSGGTFGYDANNNFTGPAASGTYTITFNFQTGNFSITQ